MNRTWKRFCVTNSALFPGVEAPQKGPLEQFRSTFPDPATTCKASRAKCVKLSNQTHARVCHTVLFLRDIDLRTFPVLLRPSQAPRGRQIPSPDLSCESPRIPSKIFLCKSIAAGCFWPAEGELLTRTFSVATVWTSSRDSRVQPGRKHAYKQQMVDFRCGHAWITSLCHGGGEKYLWKNSHRHELLIIPKKSVV